MGPISFAMRSSSPLALGRREVEHHDVHGGSATNTQIIGDRAQPLGIAPGEHEMGALACP